MNVEPRSARVSCRDEELFHATGDARRRTRPPPWHELPEFRALAEVRRAFVKDGVPMPPARTTEASARLAAFWTLYELGHALDEIEHRTRAGLPCWASVRACEVRPGRVVVEIAVEPFADEPTEPPAVGSTP